MQQLWWRLTFLLRSQIFMEWSFEQEASKRPLGDGRTIRIHSAWPVKVCTQNLKLIVRLRSKELFLESYPVWISQIFIVLSLLHETILSPEGKNATDETLWSCPKIMHSQSCSTSLYYLWEFWGIHNRFHWNPIIWSISLQKMKLKIQLAPLKNGMNIT